MLQSKDIVDRMVSLDPRLKGIPVEVKYKSRGSRRFGYAYYHNLGTQGFSQGMVINVDNMIAYAPRSPWDSLETFIEQTVLHEIAHLSANQTKQDMSATWKVGFWEEMKLPRYKPHGQLWKTYARRYGVQFVRATVPSVK